MIPKNNQRSHGINGLNGQWKLVITAEAIVLITEVLMYFCTFYSVFVVKREYLLLGVTAIDLLILSPLLCGRTLLYDTILDDATAVSLSLLFRYFRCGYRKSIMWRVGIWWRTCVLLFLISIIPVCLSITKTFLAEYGVIENSSLVYVGIVCGIYVFFAIGVVGAYIRYCTYTLAVHLLPYTTNVHFAFLHSRKLMHKKIVPLLNLRLCYGARFLLFPFILPWFYLSPLFRVSVSTFYKERAGKFPEKKLTEGLHIIGNHGKIKK